MLYLSYLVVLLCVKLASSGQLDRADLNVPEGHISYFSYSLPELGECQGSDCVNKENKCWGYERGCSLDNYFSYPNCPGLSEQKADTFFNQADFGYIRNQGHELTAICEVDSDQETETSSSLKCSKHLRFCTGENIMLNFTSLLHRDEMIRYKMDVLTPGDIGGNCRLNKSKLVEESDHMSPLQSWAPELRFFRSLSPEKFKQCDFFIEKPTYLMKIDATVNMYHHFCDFFNLYATQHVELSQRKWSFSTDNHMLLWENYKYSSSFGHTWDAFTSNPLWDLDTFKGKTVCFRQLVLPLLPRMIFGLFYNTPIVAGCHGSGLFRAFSEHVLYRLRIPLHQRTNSRVRITFLSRATKYRNVLNENALLKALRTVKHYEVKQVVYNRELSFKQQLEITRNTDILIGMHGAGLTHLLFLPDWAAVFELYNCEDEHCYKDLARLRGIKYMTWRDPAKVYPEDQGQHPDGGAHAKFTNYKFDVSEFLKIVKQGYNHVVQHPAFIRITSVTHDEL